MINNLNSLDDLVEKKAKKVTCRGFDVQFRRLNSNPGHGELVIKGTFNDAEFSYSKDLDFTQLNLKKDGESVSIKEMKGSLMHVCVNDKYYFSHDLGEVIPTGERPEAFEFGENALNAIQEYLKQKAPEAVQLMEGYVSRTLMVPDARPEFRSNKEIFDKFDLRVKYE